MNNTNKNLDRRTMAFQIMMRDTHGVIETENWGVVTNAGTFDKTGNPIAGGMYDPNVFDIREEDFSSCSSNVNMSKFKSPEDVVGQIGIMELALPVCDPYCPSEIEPDKWIHLTKIPVLPIQFRAIDCNSKWVSYEAKLWNKLAELNFAIPKLLDKNPEQKAELQQKLQKAVNAVYSLYNQFPIPENELEMHLFLYHAMMPVMIDEDYNTILSRIKTIKDMAELMRNSHDAEEYFRWIRTLCRICNVVGYDSDEIEEYHTWAEESLDRLDDWMTK
jgi:hypothetical protein